MVRYCVARHAMVTKVRGSFNSAALVAGGVLVSETVVVELEVSAIKNVA